MFSAQANAVLGKLTAEGVAPWLVRPRGRSQSSVPGPVPEGVRGIEMPGRSPLAAVRDACDTMLSRGGLVSVGVEPDLGPDATAGSWVAAARTVRGGVDRANVLVRIPATPAGIHATAECLAEGIGVISTGVYSPGQYRAVLDAQLAGAERALADRVDLREVVAVACCPVGRLDAEVNARLARSAGAPADELRNSAGLATARLMHRIREERLADAWWGVLRTAGAPPPMLMWSQTGPSHIAALIGWNTAHLMTAESVESAAAACDLRGDTLLGRHHTAQRLVRRLADRGVLLETVTAHLQRLG